MFMRNTTARDWILRYIEMRHDLNDPKEILRLAQSADYLDQNANVTDTGKLLLSLVNLTASTKTSSINLPELHAPAFTLQRALNLLEVLV